MDTKKYNRLLNKIKNFIGSSKVVFGFSGGADSVFLFYVLVSILKPSQIKAVHLNHLIRSNSREDELFVKDICKEYGVKLYSESHDVSKISEYNRQNLEALARDLRRDFFERVKIKEKCKYIITAHHKNDLIETVFFNVIRGTSLKGLIGIKEITGPYYRPLLDCTKSDIIKYLKKHSYRWKEDETNLDTSYTRNYIRNKLIPNFFNKYGVDKSENIIKEISSIANKLSKWLEKKVLNYVGKILRDNTIDLSEFKLHDKFFRLEIIKKLLEKKAKKSDGIYRNLLSELDKFILTASSGSIKSFGLKHFLLKEFNKISILDMDSKIQNDSIDLEISTNKASQVKWKDLNIKITISNKNIDLKDSNCYFCSLDRDKIGDIIIIRSYKEGDIFRPSSMKGRKKLKKFFIDQKIKISKRMNIPIFTTIKNDIICVGGLRSSEDYKSDKDTNNFITIQIEKDKP